MKSHTYRAAALVLLLALWCAPAVWAEDTTTASSGAAGSFQLEQVYVNAPELDVYFYATDADGSSYSPIVVQAQEVEATLGDRKLDTGMIGVADDPICYIIALDNSSSIDAEDFHKMRTAIWKLAQTKQEKDQIMVYTLAGGVQCALPATNDKAEIFNTLRTIEQSEGAIDLTGAAASLAADIRAEYQSLAPRKAAFICTDATQVMTNLALLGGTLGTDQSSLNMAMYTFICTAAPERLESMTQMANGKVVACRHEDLAAEMQAKQTWFAQALTLRTEVPDSLTGERQEVFTLSVPKLGSAVKSSTTVYMGFKMEKPQVTKVEPLGRTKLRLTFNQAVNANADRPQYYRVYTNDVWGWYVKIESVELSEDGRTAVLTTEPLYQGRYNVALNKVSSRMTPANVSTRQQSCTFMVARWPRDRKFYMGRFSMPLTIAAVLLGALTLNWLLLRRRERGAEQAAEAEHLLAGAASLDGTDALPKRWVTLFWAKRGSIAESRWAGIVESSLILGSDAAQCDLCLPDSRIRPQHAVLAVRDEALLVQPLGPDTTVFVNGERIAGEHCLQNNDTLRLGRTTIRLVL